MIEKKRSPKGKSIRVTFTLPSEVARKSVAVVGDFNEWDARRNPMQRDKKSGQWKTAISLKPDNTYRFRYFIDKKDWRNDEQADGVEPNPYFSENSVLVV